MHSDKERQIEFIKDTFLQESAVLKRYLFACTYKLRYKLGQDKHYKLIHIPKENHKLGEMRK